MDHDDFYFLVLNLGSVPQEFNFGEIFYIWHLNEWK